MKNYLVVGRMCGDDEDTVIVYHAASREDAVGLYLDDMWEVELSSYTDPDERQGLREKAEAIGEGYFVNHVFESETPITRSTWRCRF